MVSQPRSMTEGAESVWDLLFSSSRSLRGHTTSEFEGRYNVYASEDRETAAILVLFLLERARSHGRAPYRLCLLDAHARLRSGLL